MNPARLLRRIFVRFTAAVVIVALYATAVSDRAQGQQPGGGADASSANTDATPALVCPPTKPDNVDLTPSEQESVETAKAFAQMLPTSVLPMPGRSPQLPLTGNDPFPIETKTVFYDLRDESQRYLQELPPNVKYKKVTREGKEVEVPVLHKNVQQNGTTVWEPVMQNGEMVEVHVDHPRVQPRAHRSKHYRLYVDNIQGLPKTVPVERCESDALIPPRAALVQPPESLQAAEEPVINTKRFLPEIAPRQKLFVTYVQTAPAMFPEIDPFIDPPGTNMLPTVYQNMRDRYGNEMVNTLPSHPNNPYNLHLGEPQVTRLATQLSPTDDLSFILDSMFESVTEIPARRLWETLDSKTLEDVMNETKANHEQNIARNRTLLLQYAQWAIDMLEGKKGESSKVPSNRAYRGFALLHHSGHKRQSENGRLNRVQPVFDKAGNVIGGHTEVHQVWYDGRIESDTMFFDFGWDDEYETDNGGQLYAQRSAMDLGKPESRIEKQKRKRPARIPPHVPWTVTYTINVLSRGEDDFSPTQVYFDELQRIDGNLKDKAVPFGRIFNPPRDPDKFKELDNPHPELKTIYAGHEGENVPVRFGPPHTAMDQTFFPLAEGTSTKITLKMAPPKNSNVTYTWGWRKHPPRAQAVENSHKRIPPGGPELVAEGSVINHPTWPGETASGLPPLPPFARLRITDHERFVFEGLPQTEEHIKHEAAEYFRNFGTLNETQTLTQLEEKFCKLSHVPFFHPTEGLEGGPIARIGDLAPAKRMWRVFRRMKENLANVRNANECLEHILEAHEAFLDWKDRNHLPSGVEPDPCSDFTILYVNNTIYGESRHGGLKFDEWRTRVPDPENVERQKGDLRLAIINGDYFLHGYINPDFGGKSGWENQFKPTVALGGTGSFFSFGRFNWRFNTEPGAIGIPPAVMMKKKNGQLKDYVHDHNGTGTFLSPDGEPIYDGTQPDGVRPFVHRVWIRYNFEPSRRLRFYQFDPLHHDVAIYSIH